MIALVLALVGFGFYCASRYWAVRRGNRLGSGDPLLQTFIPGHPAILYFTSEHCGPCRVQQRPALARLREILGETSVQIIEVDTDRQLEDAQRWGVMTLPTTYVLDKKGRPHMVNYGVTSTDKLKRQIEQITSGKVEG
jgi:thiol-disulfide isomerase/thioredoxin